ncbi:MAG: hypothetical protein LC115_06550 [Bacteroidia bacterium]|nr:hypothetical protein [Bacteroidia bacterium]
MFAKRSSSEKKSTIDAPKYHLLGIRTAIPIWQLCWLLNQKYQFEIVLHSSQTKYSENPHYLGKDQLTDCELIIYEKLDWLTSLKAQQQLNQFTAFMVIIPPEDSSLDANYYLQLLNPISEIEYSAVIQYPIFSKIKT